MHLGNEFKHNLYCTALCPVLQFVIFCISMGTYRGKFLIILYVHVFFSKLRNMVLPSLKNQSMCCQAPIHVFHFCIIFLVLATETYNCLGKVDCKWRRTFL